MTKQEPKKIPKIIHYCWFGEKEMSSLNKKCIKSWEKHLKGYKILLWNEKNIDINSHKYIKFAYEQKNYSTLSNYVRLLVLKKYGGIYLDTDMEIIKPFPNEILENECFFEFENENIIGSAIIGAKKNHYFIKNLLLEYDK